MTSGAVAGWTAVLLPRLRLQLRLPPSPGRETTEAHAVTMVTPLATRVVVPPPVTLAPHLLSAPTKACRLLRPPMMVMLTITTVCARGQKGQHHRGAQAVTSGRSRPDPLCGATWPLAPSRATRTRHPGCSRRALKHSSSTVWQRPTQTTARQAAPAATRTRTRTRTRARTRTRTRTRTAPASPGISLLQAIVYDASRGCGMCPCAACRALSSPPRRWRSG